MAVPKTCLTEACSEAKENLNLLARAANFALHFVGETAT
jgi:hypothetical protein